jgi:putative ABC transport system permease protein
MKFSFGPSEIPQWKENNFQMFNTWIYLFKEYDDIRAEVAFQILQRESLKYDSNVVSDVWFPFPMSLLIFKLNLKRVDLYKSESNSGAKLSF